MKKYSFIILILITNYLLGQDGKQQFDYKTRFDSIKNIYIYYEKIDLNNSNIFDDNNYRIIKSKTISNNLSSKKILNGVVVEEVFFKINETGTINYLYNDENYLKCKIYCKDNKLQKVEKFKNSKICESFNFGLNEVYNRYDYYNRGYFVTEVFNGQIIKYDFSLKDNKNVNKTLLNKSSKESVIVDLKENIIIDDNEPSKVYSDFINYCSPR